MKDIIKEYADLVSEKKQALAEKVNQEELDKKNEQEKTFNEFKDQVKIDSFLNTICSMLDKDHTKVTISVFGKFIIPDDKYKGDTRLDLYWGYEQLRKPSFFERLRNLSYWSKQTIPLVSEDGEIYELLWESHKSPVPLYVVEDDGNFRKYHNKVMKFPIKEFIQKDSRYNAGTKLMPGDEEITLVISNGKTETSYTTKLSSKNLGVALKHKYESEWTVRGDIGRLYYTWTGAILVQDNSDGNKTFVDFLTEIFKKIDLNFTVLSTKIKEYKTKKLPLFEISLKEDKEKGN